LITDAVAATPCDTRAHIITADAAKESFMADFKFAPRRMSLRDVEAIARCRAIKREDIDSTPTST
jgi:hypothetical protein